jgi:hypothetical protein
VAERWIGSTYTGGEVGAINAVKMRVAARVTSLDVENRMMFE